MSKSEIRKAVKMLEEYAERTETAISGNGQSLTAYWYGGGQAIFWTFGEVEEWVESRKRR